MWALRDRMNRASIPLDSLRVALVGVALSLPGCSEPGTSTPFYTPTGVVPQTASPPATSVPTSAAPPAHAAGHDGTYRGISTVLSSGAGRCFGRQNITGFEVRGNRARWDGFRGTIDPDGGVQMHHGVEWLVGQFEEGRFVGQLEIGKWSSSSSCVYMFTLDRVGP